MRYSRQNKILELITENEIQTQEKLAALLKDAGYDVTQATVSRDIKELQLIKVQTPNGTYKYSQSVPGSGKPTDRYVKILQSSVTSYNLSENLILISTISGCGGAVGEAIDVLSLPHVIGTVSGTSSILIVLDDKANGQSVCQNLHEFLQ